MPNYVSGFTEIAWPGESKAWAWLAVFCLLVGSLMAVVLVLAKMPVIAVTLGLPALFPVALVYHVNFTILFWVGSCSALVWNCLFPGRWRWLDSWSVRLAGAALMMLLLGVAAPRSALLNNYVPLMDVWPFYSGLALFMVALLMTLVNRAQALLAALCAEPDDSRWLFSMIALSWLVALLVFLLAWWKLPQGYPQPGLGELVFWGPGHVLQAANLMLLLGGWCWLTGYRCGYFVARCVQAAMYTTLMLALILAVTLSPADPLYRDLFTAWMRYFSLPAGLLIGLPLLFAGFMRAAPVYGFLRSSLLLLGVGMLIGAIIQVDNLLVPAHYHAVTGALNLMLMVTFYRLLNVEFGQHSLAGRQLMIYAAGVGTLVAGLGSAGLLGVGRKLAGTAQGLDEMVQQAAIGLMGLGGLIALLGCFLFLVLVSERLLSVPRRVVAVRTEVV